MSIKVEVFFDEKTAAFTYVVSDPITQKAAVIDSILDYDQYSGRAKTDSADGVISYIKQMNLELEWILETHIHADHLTAAHYIKSSLGGKIGIGSLTTEILKHWVPIFNSGQDTPIDGSQFDNLFENNETFKLGEQEVMVMHTPGHTPACVSYKIGDAIFVGDTVFMPDVGTARADFPGGNAEIQYDSIQTIFSLPENTRVFLCHDYPPEGRDICYMTTIKEQKEKNILINNRITKERYVEIRHERDKGKLVPNLLLPSIQVNLRAGDFGQAEENGVCYIKVPLNRI